MATIKISDDVTLLCDDDTGAPVKVFFDGDEVSEGGEVSDDSASYVLTEIERRTGHRVTYAAWAGPFPGEGRRGTDSVVAKLAAR